MQRRTFLKYLAAGSLAGIGGTLAVKWPDEGVLNPCLSAMTPRDLLEHDVVLSAWEGVDPYRYRDVHTHLIGTGDSGSGIYLHPSMQDIFSPAQYIRYKFYINASCSDSEAGIDNGYVAHLQRLYADFPQGAKSLLLAFEYNYHDDGIRDIEHSPFFTPNEYAQRIASEYGERFEWIASVHPYRQDCVEVLEMAVTNGARAVKWLPPVMGIDPSSPACDRFYAAMARLNVPLLTHAGDEHAVDGVDAQSKGNPLLLRRALEHGVRVIVAHCASEGLGDDVDQGNSGRKRTNFELFARLMDEKQYEGLLFGEISAMTQLNRMGVPLQTVIQRDDWHHRLVNGSDYPLPGVMPLFSTRRLAAEGYLPVQAVKPLTALRQHNPLLYDFVLKRQLRWQGKAFASHIFESRAVFNTAGQNTT